MSDKLMCIIPNGIHKNTPSVDQNKWLKRLNTQLNVRTNQKSLNSPKLLSQRIRKCYHSYESNRMSACPFIPIDLANRWTDLVLLYSVASHRVGVNLTTPSPPTISAPRGLWPLVYNIVWRAQIFKLWPKETTEKFESKETSFHLGVLQCRVLVGWCGKRFIMYISSFFCVLNIFTT